MNTIAWGPYCWNFTHQLAWLFPHEILSLEDASAVVQYCHLFVQIIPCIYCSSSATKFEKRFGLLKTLVKNVNGFSMITRADITRYWYDFHNQVNVKLEAPMYKTSWRETVKQRPDWMGSFWVFAFCICWNYPEENNETQSKSRQLIVSFFGYVIPRILKYTNLGKSYRSALLQYPLVEETFISRSILTKWIYNIRNACSDVMGPTWTYRDTDVMMEAFRARNHTCSEPISEKQLLEATDAKMGCQ